MTALFFMTAAKSHHFASFGLSRHLNTKGFHIIYAGEKDFEEFVQEQGFEFRYFPTSSLQEMLTISNWTVSEMLKCFATNVKASLTSNQKSNFEFLILELEYFAAKMRPDIIFIDTFHSLLLPVFSKLRYNCVLLQTMVSTFQVTGIPPPTCALVPANTATWRYRVSLEWSLYRAKKFFDRCLIRVVFFGLDSKSLMLSWVSRQPSLRKLQWVRRKAFHVGFLNVPELILSPEEFDFGVDKRIRNQFHVGPLIDLERRESLTDPSLQQLAAQIDKDRTVLYCTFGTLSLEANKGKMSRFISQLIKGVASRPKWTLVLSADKSILPTDGGESSNVLIYDWMPQLWFLNHCKVVITHGGLNSTMEALSFGCPLLAVPLNDQWDQPGNAARIEYHGLGLQGRMTDSSDSIVNKIDRILTEETFVKNARAMKDIIGRRSERLTKVEEVLKALGLKF